MTINTNNEIVTRQEFSELQSRFDTLEWRVQAERDALHTRFDALESLLRAVIDSMNIQEVNKGFTYQVGEKLSQKESELRQRQDAREDKEFFYGILIILEFIILMPIYSMQALGSTLKESWKTASFLQAKNSGVRSIAYFVIIGFSAHLIVGFIMGIHAYVKYYIITYDLLQLGTNIDILKDKLPIILLGCTILMLIVYIIIHSFLIRALSIMHPKWLLLKYQNPFVPGVVFISAILMASLIWQDFVAISPKIKVIPHIKEYLAVMHTPFWLLMAGVLALIVIFSDYIVSKEYIKKHPILTHDINKPTI